MNGKDQEKSKPMDPWWHNAVKMDDEASEEEKKFISAPKLWYISKWNT